MHGHKLLTAALGTTLTAALALTGTSADAAITGTFVAAQDGVNTFQSVDGTSNFSTNVSEAQALANELWYDRSGGTFNIVGISPSGGYQGQNTTVAGTPRVSPEIVTTLTGLTPGMQYNIDIVYGISTSPTSGFQNIDAGFVSDSLTTITEAGGTATGEVLGAGGPWVAYQSNIGTKTADGSGNIAVYVKATTGAERSVYNGLAYSEVPEPGSLALLGLGGLLVARRRRHG